jgi:hypothetical protein
MRTMRALLVALTTACVVAGCSGSSTPLTDTLSTPTPTGSGGAVMLTAAESRQAGIYIALLEKHLFIEPGLFDTAYIDPVPGRDGTALSAPVQQVITAHFRSRMDVRWGDADDPDADYVHLPVLPDDRDAFQVLVGDICGNLCGHGQRYRVTRHGDEWKATPVGAMAVS